MSGVSSVYLEKKLTAIWAKVVILFLNVCGYLTLCGFLRVSLRAKKCQWPWKGESGGDCGVETPDCSFGYSISSVGGPASCCLLWSFKEWDGENWMEQRMGWRWGFYAKPCISEEVPRKCPGWRPEMN